MLNVKPFYQRPEYCGPACLKMVFSYFNVHKTERELVRFSGYKKGIGVGGKNLIAIAKKYGFKAFMKDFSDFKDIRFYVQKKKIPVIVNWFSENDGHYSVVIGIDKENIYLQDPELGHHRSFRLEDFKRIWFDFHGCYLKTKNQLNIRRMIVIEQK